MSDYGPFEDEYATDVAFQEYLNEVYPTVKCAGLVFDPAEVIKLDGPAYREMFNNWLDGLVS